MANNPESDSRELSSINSNAEEETLTLGGPTAKEEGTEYQFVSEIGRQVGSQLGATDAENVEQKGDSGREPEYYFERQAPE